MEPAGQRAFTSAADARAAAFAACAESFVVLHQMTGLGFDRKPEYAWVGPSMFFLTRMPAARKAGIKIVKDGE